MWSKSLLAGFCIGIAVLAFLNVGGIFGMILFSLGLILVVQNKFSLFTGTAGFVENRKDLLNLPLIFFFNWAGVWALSLLAGYLPKFPNLQETALEIIETRFSMGYEGIFLLSLGCGFLMTEAVEWSRKSENYLPLLFCVPGFIACGFPHCVADSFAYCIAWNKGLDHTLILQLHGLEILGNFIGCNIKRSLLWVSK